jgi:two-component system, sensor histidine kinase and response regulator
MEDPLKILIVDDDPVDRMAVRRALKTAQVETEIAEACTCAEAIAMLKTAPFDCAFLDYQLPDQDGLALVQMIRSQGILSPLIMLTGQGDEQIAVELMKAGATDYLSKAKISPERLARALMNAMRVYQAEQQAILANQRLQESHALLVQKNQELEQQRQQIQAQNTQLQQTIAEREELALRQKDFISHLTHDLRTPLFASDTMLKMFQKEAFCPLPEQMHVAIAAMIRSNRNLIQIVDTLLEVHSYEAGMKTLNFIPCDLWAIGNEVIQELLPLATDKGIELKIQGYRITEHEGAAHEGTEHEDTEVVNGTPTYPKVQGDYLELRRMLTNLLGNSIKFTDSGSVTLSLSSASATSSDNQLGSEFSCLVLKVQDTGFGMSETEQANLFERFRKGTHKQSGSGLGLHLVARIVQVHQGKIEVSSALGVGSLFTIYLPLTKALRQSESY